MMRRFRRDVTEFVLDPASEPAGFARHLWRYPLRFELALEYLCIGAHEFAALFATPPSDDPAEGETGAWQLYGFPSAVIDDRPWGTIAVRLPELLARTGLAYCDLVHLQASGLIRFGILPVETDDQTDGDTGDPQPLPACKPCCLGDWRVAFPEEADQEFPRDGLVRLALAVRLWRFLRRRCAGGITFATLADLDSVLHVFTSGGPVGVDPEFLREVAALLLLCEDLGLPLLADPRDLPPAAGPVDRVPLLALWTGAGGAGPGWARAVRMLLDGVEDTAERAEPDLRRSPELLKVLADNLASLSQLCGFDPSTPSDTWWARPTHTLRFAEVLLKVYRSRFTVGELLFLYTAQQHLAGDDPFPLQDESEAIGDPLALGDTEPAQDGEVPFSLWALRAALQAVHADDDDVRAWSWPRILASLRHEFGYVPAAAGPDPLEALGQHLFPEQLERIGVGVAPSARRYAVPLAAADTSPLMWADTPLRYDATAEELSIELPLRDRPLLDALLHLRPLRTAERHAVRDLYFAPRAALAPFAALFENPVAAIEHLVRHGDGDERFEFFRAAFALFHRRCAVLAEHLARHVLSATDDDPDGARVEEATRVAWRVLRSLWADENVGRTPWEDDAGAPPDVTWGPRPSGGAFAALLGLLGTGLVGEFGALPSDEDDDEGREDEEADPTGPVGLQWREVRGP